MRITSLITIAALLAVVPNAYANPAGKPKPATRADIERLEQKIAAQRKLIETLVRIQQEYAAALAASLGDPNAVPPKIEPKAAPKIEPKVDAKPDAPKLDKPAAKPIKREPVEKPTGTIVGTVSGGSDVYVYVENLAATATGTASMKQEGKQFVPRVLVVQKGTRVDFPNRDAIFHNVFSLTPDNSFDLGSYPQGELRSVKMSRPGVVNVYCNMHSQMVGYILVVPGSHYVRAAADGSFRLTVPPGHHRIVAWAPNAKPIAKEVDVGSETVSMQFELKQGAAPAHTKKDGLPYGSYKE